MKCSSLGRTASSKVRHRVRGMSSVGRKPVIDMHAHFLPESWPCFASRHGGTNWPSMRRAGRLPSGTFGYNRKCDAMLMSGGSDYRPVTRACWDVAARLEDLDQAGIDIQIMSATPILFQWERSKEVALDVARHFNDDALSMCDESGGRLRSLCQVPLQDVESACRELERAMNNGHVGVHIGNHIGSRDLEDAELVAFLQYCAHLDAPVLVHPWDMDSIAGRLDKFMMGWTVGMPLETHLSITAMILGGAFDKLPRSLRLCFAHGGGAFPFLLGRLENAWRERSVARGKSLHPPSFYLDRFSVDSAVFDTRALQLLVDTMGEERVMLGSDYPFPLGEQEIGSLIRKSSLSDRVRERIMGGNACAFFSLEAEAEMLTKEKQPLEELTLQSAQNTGKWQEPQLQQYQKQQLHKSANTCFIRTPTSPVVTNAFMQGNRHNRLPAPSARAYTTSTVATACDRIGQLPVYGQFTSVQNHVGGQQSDATSGVKLPLIDAATGAARGEVVASSVTDVDMAVQVASCALNDSEWSSMSAAARAAILHRSASLLEAESEAFAAAESADTGKPLRLAQALDVPRAAHNMRFFAGLVEHSCPGVLRQNGGADRSHEFDAALNYSIRKPVGVVGLITPWNLPLYLLTWKLAPALAMGNTVVAKPSELTPTTATMLAELMERAGLPQGVFNVVHGTGSEAGSALCTHPDVRALSFTGGTASGATVAAAVAPRFAKLSLELGGKNAMVVFADCDFELAVTAAVRAAFLNSGQICLCASRILVQNSADGFYERFASAFSERVFQLRVGHPQEPETDIGPLISASQRDKLVTMTEAALALPNVIARCGGPADERIAALTSVDDGAGHWFAPTVLDGCELDSHIAQEEVFGPVVTLHPFHNDEDAISAANCTKYGLAASVWTENVTRAHTVAQALEAGTIWINCWLHRQLHMPFGGVKASGVSREGGEASLDFFSETSSICLKLGNRQPPPMPGVRKSHSASAAIATKHRSTGASMFPPSGDRANSQHKRAFNTSTASCAAHTDGCVASAPKPLGAYVHARKAGELLFLAGLGPRNPTDDSVPGGSIENADGSRANYDAGAQTRACIANVQKVLGVHGLDLSDIMDVQCFLVDMKRDFAAFNSEYTSAFGVLAQPPTRTTVQVQELPPGGRIAVELKVIARCRDSADFSK